MSVGNGIGRIGRRSLVGALAIGALMLAGCDAMIPRFEPIRYKLQAEVETPTGVKTGYSVIEVRLEKSLHGFKVKGEAAAVDIAPGQALFVLLRSPQTVDWGAQAINFFPGTAKLGPGETGHDAEVRRTGRALDAMRADRNAYPVWVAGKNSADPEKSWPGTPYFVRFKNIRDPKTVERVDPDDLAKTFGPGFKLKSLTVQVTDEPVTNKMSQKLSMSFWRQWGAIHQREMDKGSINENPYFSSFSGLLSRDDFVKDSSQ